VIIEWHYHNQEQAERGKAILRDMADRDLLSYWQIEPGEIWILVVSDDQLTEAESALRDAA
jgi:hypothetical protein